MRPTLISVKCDDIMRRAGNGHLSRPNNNEKGSPELTMYVMMLTG